MFIFWKKNCDPPTYTQLKTIDSEEVIEKKIVRNFLFCDPHIKTMKSEEVVEKNNICLDPPTFLVQICFDPRLPRRQKSKLALIPPPPAWLYPLVKKCNPERLLR